MLHEVKGKLARLLATENLIIEHRSVETAQFDVVRRVLTLPIWNFSSVDVYDLLVAHEVGHALFTDPRDWSKEEKWKDVPLTFLNITEDARIEKLMKRKYAGLNKTFYRGYSDLNADDFFDIANEDLDTFSLPDRINLHFKLSNHVKIDFTPAETTIVDAVGTAETFEDALQAALLLNDHVNQDSEPTEAPEVPANPVKGNTSDIQQQSPPTSQDDKQEDTDGKETEETEQQVPNQTKDESNEGETKEDRPEDETRTAAALEKKLKQMADTTEQEISYVTIPKVNLKHTVVSAAEIHEYAEGVWSEYLERMKNESEVENVVWYENRFIKTDQRYNQFKKDSAKEVNYLVKEFECKKSASAYSRAATSRTGVLDCAKLHTYKYNEDLFKKVTVLPEGKNHGLIFVLDWSGSMCDVLLSTIKQLYNLIWFCRKVGIPYDVYAFSNEWNYKSGRLNPVLKEDNKIWIPDEFSMLNLLTSKVNNSTADRQMKNIWKIASSFRDYYGITPPKLYLSGTPLNEAIISLHSILPDFKKRNGVEKINCVVLTDGEAHMPSRTVRLQRSWENTENIRHRRITDNTFLRNLKTGEIHRLTMVWHRFTKILLEDLKSTFPGVNVIGFRIIEGGGGYNSMISSYIHDWDSSEKARRSWKKEKTFTVKGAGYESYFVIGDSVLSNDSNFEVRQDATKAQIRNAFKKSLGAKKMNKRILNEFVSLVA
jgi:hypothetical protein